MVNVNRYTMLSTQVFIIMKSAFHDIIIKKNNNTKNSNNNNYHYTNLIKMKMSLKVVLMPKIVKSQ